MTIFDINHPYVTKQWVYTAVTRARELSKVYIFDGQIDEIKVKERWRKVVYRKIKDHTVSCIGKDHYLLEEYVTVRDVMKDLEESCCCRRCGHELQLDGNRQLVLNRIDNNLGLLKNNFELMCFICNTKYG